MQSPSASSGNLGTAAHLQALPATSSNEAEAQLDEPLQLFSESRSSSASAKTTTRLRPLVVLSSSE